MIKTNIARSRNQINQNYTISLAEVLCTNNSHNNLIYKASEGRYYESEGTVLMS